MDIKEGDYVLVKNRETDHLNWVKVTDINGFSIIGQVFAAPMSFHYGIRMTDLRMSQQYKVFFTEKDVVSRYTRELDINLRLRRLVEMGIEGDGPEGLNRGSGFWKMAIALINNHKHLRQQSPNERSYTYCLWGDDDIWHDKHDPKKSTVIFIDRYGDSESDSEGESESDSETSEDDLKELKLKLAENDRKIAALEKMIKRI